MPATWTPGNIAHPGPGGFIIGGDYFFQKKTKRALDELYQTASGAVIVGGIMTSKRVAIVPARGRSNFIRSEGEGLRCLLAQAWIDHNHNTAEFATELQFSRVSAGLSVVQLAQRINAIPRYRIQGIPSVAPGNYGVLPAFVTNWENNLPGFPGGMNFPPANSVALTRDLYNAVCCALWDHLRPSATPNGSQISWTATDGLLKIPSLGVSIVKRAVIGLGHELTHAYYSARGLQLNTDNSDSDEAVLFEHMAMGVGHWEGQPGENTMRAEIAGLTRESVLGIDLKYGVQPRRNAYG